MRGRWGDKISVEPARALDGKPYYIRCSYTFEYIASGPRQRRKADCSLFRYACFKLDALRGNVAIGVVSSAGTTSFQNGHNPPASLWLLSNDKTQGLVTDVQVGDSFVNGDIVGVGILNNQLFFARQVEGVMRKTFVECSLLSGHVYPAMIIAGRGTGIILCLLCSFMHLLYIGTI